MMTKNLLIYALITFSVLFSGCSNNQEQRTELTKDLIHYPNFFFENKNHFNAVIIIDEFAAEEDIISGNLLLDSFRQRDKSLNSDSIKIYPKYSNLQEKNAILIGSCSQEPHNKFVNFYVDCLSMKPGQAIIRIIEHQDIWLLNIVGYDTSATRNAIEVLVDYKQYNLARQDVEVFSKEEELYVGEVT